MPGNSRLARQCFEITLQQGGELYSNGKAKSKCSMFCVYEQLLILGVVPKNLTAFNSFNK
jgi:hypothetical protein